MLAKKQADYGGFPLFFFLRRFQNVMFSLFFFLCQLCLERVLYSEIMLKCYGFKTLPVAKRHTQKKKHVMWFLNQK